VAVRSAAPSYPTTTTRAVTTGPILKAHTMHDDDIGFWQALILAVITGAAFYLTIVFLFSL
jgi:hypothetical protein